MGTSGSSIVFLFAFSMKVSPGGVCGVDFEGCGVVDDMMTAESKKS